MASNGSRQILDYIKLSSHEKQLKVAVTFLPTAGMSLLSPHGAAATMEYQISCATKWPQNVQKHKFPQKSKKIQKK